MNSNRLGFIGICRRAGKAIFGYDKVQRELQVGSLKLVLTAADFSQKTTEKLRRICEEKSVPIIFMEDTMDEINYSVGIKSGVIGITDNGFADKLKTY